MDPKVIFPGTFCPPTYGHLEIVRKAAVIFPELIVICSKNSDKNNNWFAPEECVEMWLTYELPINVRVMTFDDFFTKEYAGESIVMVRGIRDDKDFEYEKQVMMFNFDNYQIDQYFYIITSKEFHEISSSRVRDLAGKLALKDLSKFVSPLIITKLLERVLKARNVFLVVGRPGTGKTTFLKQLSGDDPRNHVIFTDRFNHVMRPILEQHFPGQDLCQVMCEHEDRCNELIEETWLTLLSDALRESSEGSNIFIEIAYGLAERYSCWKYVGGKVVGIFCARSESEARLISRGTPGHHVFIERIPDQRTSRHIANANGLKMMEVNNDGTLKELAQKARTLSDFLNQGG